MQESSDAKMGIEELPGGRIQGIQCAEALGAFGETELQRVRLWISGCLIHQIYVKQIK